MRPNGYAGPLGYASAGVMADYVLVDMFAEAVTGQASTDDAIANAREAGQPLLPADPARRPADARRPPLPEETRPHGRARHAEPASSHG